MESAILYTLLSVLIVSAVSLIGIISLAIRKERLKNFLLYFLSFSAGAMLGDVFLHLLPEVIEQQKGLSMSTSFFVLFGILVFFSLEKIVHWQHCHMPITKYHVHPLATMNLVGDGLHNFIDGLIIAGSYLISIPAGIATSLAVLFHEIPQEMGDFGVLLHAGFTRRKALLMNFASALLAVFGAIVAFVIGSYTSHIEYILVPLAAGGFLYIAGSDLIPELHKESAFNKAVGQIITFLIGIGAMWLLLYLG